ncbi:TetR/AcrR family transcriptional regulator [Mucilaginibacter sp. KACC 22063]|uniref:TetR/AcrR family transcriptional regulator n=1 Tax=Mucilaginibacter sp. KACC 22063 TaxID=3025666 RepID=UPI00236520DA|nr:TetR/AcrR family transcriptional regulator [Mucilaginibacter sp. KACC 22063]WDF54361.1 helix-turn-helix domain containing protein [Mucilaginibacter sp. KACC 22063]
MNKDILKKENEAVTDRVKEEIIEGAEIAFKKYGYTRVTMQDISKEAKKVRSTVYKYFDNKTEVLNAVTGKIMSAILKDCSTVVSKRRSFSANIDQYFRRKLENIKLLVSDYELLVNDLKTDPGLIILKSRTMLEDELLLMGTMIQWAMENDDIKSLSDEDRLFLAETLHTAFKSFEMEIILFGRFPNYEDKLSWLAQLLQKGLS